MRHLTWLIAALPCAVAAAPLSIDGRLDEGEWRQAQEYRDFRQVQPLTGKPSPYHTRARMLSTPEGLAVGFDVHQPRALTRSKPNTPRDQAGSADRVNVYVDYDGNGQNAYNYTVSLANSIEDGTLVNENQFSTDWDGDWQHAVTEHEDGYTVEVLLPWSLTAMQKREGDTRRLGIHFDQVIQATGERFALGGISYANSRYVSAFTPADVQQFEQSLLNVYPYVSVLSDQVAEDLTTRAGVDLFWKPRSDFQLTATINPDFGQVESDDLVIDFSAIETYFSDKRPFFTENQGPFQLSAPDDAELIYTRRIGGERDDGQGASDIDAALKLNGSSGAFDYAYFGALEDDYSQDLGRAYNVLRTRYALGAHRLGYVITDTDRPYLDRRATVHGADFDTSFSGLRLQGQALESRISETDTEQSDTAGWLQANVDLGENWQHELLLGHYGSEFELNDLGYLRRNNLNLAEYELSYFDREHEAGSLVGSTQWKLGLASYHDDSGLRLNDEYTLSQQAELHNGAVAYAKFGYETAGHDDLISRGHGVWDKPARPKFYAEYETTRVGDWKWFAGAWVAEEGLSKPFVELTGVVKYFVSDALNLRLELKPRFSQDWLIWEEDAAFGRYERTQWSSNFDATYIPVNGQELRFKLQWLSIAAEDGSDYRLREGEMVATGATRPDFTLNNLGVQLRYRYELAPLSDLFVVYSRGGFEDSGARPEDALGLLEDATRLRDSDQIFVKLRYKL